MGSSRMTSARPATSALATRSSTAARLRPPREVGRIRRGRRSTSRRPLALARQLAVVRNCERRDSTPSRTDASRGLRRCDPGRSTSRLRAPSRAARPVSSRSSRAWAAGARPRGRSRLRFFGQRRQRLGQGPDGSREHVVTYAVLGVGLHTQEAILAAGGCDSACPPALPLGLKSLARTPGSSRQAVAIPFAREGRCCADKACGAPRCSCRLMDGHSPTVRTLTRYGQRA